MSEVGWGRPEEAGGGAAPVHLSYGDRGGVMGGTGDRADNVFATIYMNHVLDESASADAGHPVYNDVPYIEIRIPGDPGNVVNREITDRDKRRFAAVWKAFEENKEGIVQGIPIEEMPITRREVMTLKHMGILTVEMLADIGDDKINPVVSYALRKRAQEFLNGPAALDREKDELRAQVRDLMAKVSALEAGQAAPKRRGRPPKNGEARA